MLLKKCFLLYSVGVYFFVRKEKIITLQRWSYPHYKKIFIIYPHY